MGNYRFRLSDMMPNAWFYKLKDMGKARNNNNATHSLKKKQVTTTQQSKPKQPHNSYPRKSYYFTRELIPSDDRFYNSPTNSKSLDTHLPEPPRKSSKQRLKGRPIKSSSKLVTSSVSAGCSCRASLWTKSDSPPDYSATPSDTSTEPELCGSFPPEFRSDRVLATESFDNMVSWSSSCTCRVNSNANDIVIDVDKKSITTTNFDKLDGFDSIAELELPPIITKPAKFNDMVKEVKKKNSIKEPSKHRKSSAKFEEKKSLHVKVVKEESITMKEHKTSPVRRLSVSSPGVRLRINSPRIATRRIQAHGRKSVSSTLSSSSRRSLSVSDSFAIVKSSFDPQRDFRESMVEMIMENNIRASKDLEDLLACYLSLNSDQYHDLIIKVFKQIWFDLTDIRLK